MKSILVRSIGLGIALTIFAIPQAIAANNCWNFDEPANKNFERCKSLATKGDADGQYNVAYSYRHGDGVQQDYEKALYWYKKAAAQNRNDAMFEIGNLYEYGLGVKQNYGEAIEWYRKSASKGFPAAYRALGLYYENGWGVKQHYGEALSWYKKALAAGYEGGDPDIRADIIRAEGLVSAYKDIAPDKTNTKKPKTNNKEPGPEACFKVTGITKGMAEVASDKYQVSVSSVSLYQTNNAFEEGYMYDCKFALDTPKGIKYCNGSVIENDGTYLAHARGTWDCN